MTMRSVGEVLVEELDPETQAVCDAVCGALAAVATDDPWAEPNYRHLPDFGRAWGVAFTRCGDHLCRQRIVEALEQRVRSDDDLILTTQGHIFTRAQISQYRGRWNAVTDSQTGECHWLLEWPTGVYAGGAPSYEKPEAA